MMEIEQTIKDNLEKLNMKKRVIELKISLAKKTIIDLQQDMDFILFDIEEEKSKLSDLVYDRLKFESIEWQK